MMVRETVGTGAAAGAFVDEEVATVVVVTVCVVVVVEDGVDVCADSVCRQRSAAIKKVVKPKDSLFTVVLDLGEIQRFLILSMVRDWGRNAKDRKGGDFGNQQSRAQELPRRIA